MQQYKIFGPPGTGKTTYLLNLLEEEFKRVHPTECAFVSFTRKGTYEGVERAMAKFNLERAELQYFKTIHALCFAQMGARKYDMIQRYHYKQFSEATGLKFLGYYTEELKSGNDQYLFAEQLYRNNSKAYEKFVNDLNVKKLQWVIANYRKFKKQLGLIDFTDLLEQYRDTGKSLPVKVAFIDEAQDLTTLQWEVVHKMFSACERLYIAGDDDQAIYEWSGADVKLFLQHPGKITTLSKSYRLPAAIHNYAIDVSKHIDYRQDKQFLNNGNEGVVEYATSLKDIDFSENTLILSRNNSYLNTAEETLKENAVVYTRKEEKSIDKKILSAIRKYEDWRNNKCTEQDMNLYRLYYKETNKEKPWYDILNANKEDINYYRGLLATKTDFAAEPKVELATIHSSKGSERDHVVLIMDISARVAANLEHNRDAELRCLYVAVTRAKHKLTIVFSQSRHSFPHFNLQERQNERWQ